MPFQPINFLNMPILKNPYAQDYAGLLQRGMQLGQEPQRLMRQRQQEELANALRKEQLTQAQAATPFVADRERAQLAYKLAQAKQMQQQAENPLLSQLTGIAREAAGLDYLKKSEGENSQVYKDARRRFEADLRSSDILNEYRKTLSGTAEKRAATPFKKLEMEIDEISNRKDISPEKKEELIEMAKLAQIKGISLPEFQKRSAFASNIDKTLLSINPDHLVQYAGAFGEGRKFGSGIAASLGFTLKNFKQYENALTATKLLAKQVRQFYGDSITPEVQAQLRELTNPDNWKNNPEIAKSKFLTFKNLLLQETQTYKNLLRNTKEYNINPEEEKKEKNMALIKKQKDMAEALKNQQPRTIGEASGKKTSPVKRFKYVNGAWVSA